MERISIDSHSRILFYGNRVGYVSENSAVVDPQFQNDELQSWLETRQKLSVLWKDGVYDKLLQGGEPENANAPMLKSCRIWQLKADSDVMMKFIGYDELTEKFGEASPANYNCVFDGEPDTNDLEQLYEKFNLNHPIGFTGHSLSMSDVVELYDAEGSEFHYVDRFGFREIAFAPPMQEQSMSL